MKRAAGPRFICWRVDLGSHRPAYVTSVAETKGRAGWRYTANKSGARTLSPEMVKDFEATVSRERGISFCRSVDSGLGYKRTRSRTRK
jgi:hypothetical protein